MVGHAKLQALKDKFATPADAPMPPGKRIVFDPEFKRVMDASSGTLPYANPSTFLDLPYRPDAVASENLSDLDVALIGVPLDLGVATCSGTRLGPRAIRAIERVGPFEHVLRLAPSVDHKLADVGDVPFSSRFSLEQSHGDIEAFFGKVVNAGVVPLAVGGDHSISYPILRALGRGQLVNDLGLSSDADLDRSLRIEHTVKYRLPERTTVVKA
jgi:agmatinase